MKIFQNIAILIGTLVILITAFTGLDAWKADSRPTPSQQYFALDPNNPNGDPIQLTGKMTSYNYDFPTLNGQNYSKGAISKAIITNIRTGSELVLGLLYERLAYLETKDGNYLEAKKAYNSALDFYRQDNQKLRAAELLSQLAHLEARENDYSAAKKHYEQSATLYAQINELVRSDFITKVAARLPASD